MCTDTHLQQAGKSDFTDDDVLKFASKLLNESGQTTNLHVKKALRDAGFTATQVDVSLAMDRLSFQEGWLWDFNGTYRTFFPATPPISSSPSLPTTITITAAPKVVENPVYTAVPKDGDWQVFAYDHSQPTIHIKQGVSRNAARNWYSKVYGVDYIDVAANVFNA